MKKWLCALLLWLFTLPALAKNTILILGDSLTAGQGINIEQGWVALLKDRLQQNNYPYDVINAGISGDTTSQGLARLPEALKKYQPTITIIELGANDGLRGLQLPVIRENLQQLITLAKSANSQVLLLGIRIPPNYGPQYTTQFQAMYVELAKKNAIPLVPLFLQGVDEKANLMQPDNIHPTAEAQKIMLDNVWLVLEGMLRK